MESEPRDENLESAEQIEEIETLRKPIEHLLLLLREKIDRGDFHVLIGDDASGRIPTLIFYEVLKEIYGKKGFAAPKTLFFAGSGAGFSPHKPSSKEALAKLELISKHLEHIKIHELLGESGKVLIITDTIATGNSLVPLTQALRRVGAKYEIATIGLESEDDSDKIRIEGRLGSEIFSGMDQTPAVYSKKWLSGVEKNPGDVFSTPTGNKYLVRRVDEARGQARKLSGELAEAFLSAEQK